MVVYRAFPSGIVVYEAKGNRVLCFDERGAPCRKKRQGAPSRHIAVPISDTEIHRGFRVYARTVASPSPAKVYVLIYTI